MVSLAVTAHACTSACSFLVLYVLVRSKVDPWSRLYQVKCGDLIGHNRQLKAKSGEIATVQIFFNYCQAFGREVLMSRLPAEVNELRSIKPATKISIHAMVTALSPLKKGRTCNYFDAFISDETERTHVVGFSGSQRRLLNQFMESREPVLIQDCQVKQARRGDKIEILLKGSTKIKASP